LCLVKFVNHCFAAVILSIIAAFLPTIVETFAGGDSGIKIQAVRHSKAH
jgi:hypothetical protein